MKKIILFIALSIQVLFLGAQCVNGISTNPSNPVNNQISGVVPELVNSFEWAKVLPNNSLLDYSLYDMSTTFQSSMINPYNNQNVYTHLINPSVNNRDFHWEDGWELLSFNLGYYPDLTNVEDVIDGHSDPIHQDIPYIIFYNRYRGVVRVFFNSLTGIATNFPYQGVVIRLKFKDQNNGLSGVFMPAQTILQGLDKETKVKEVESYSDHPNNSQKWAHADFQVGYDPCVCLFRSDIQVEFDFVRSSNISMKKREITVELDLFNSDGSVNYQKDFFANMSSEKSGVAIYKNIDLMVSNYQAELEKVKRQNAAAKEHNQKIAFWKKVLDLAKGGVPSVAKSFSGLGTWGEDKISQITNGDTLVSAETINKGIKEGLASGLDWLGGELLSEKPYAAAPTMPSAMFTEARYEGTIDDTASTSAASFYNPGSYTGAQGHWSFGQGITAFSYPYYNEMMGVFALLESPQIDLKSDFHDIANSTNPKNSLFSTKRAIKLNKHLKYAINPVLDIKKSDIQAMWVVKVKRAATQGVVVRHTFNPRDGLQIEVIHNETKLRQVNLTSLDVDEQGGGLKVLNTPGAPIDLTFNSELIPLDKLYDFQPELHFTDKFNPGTVNLEVEVQLRLVLDITYNNVGSDGEHTRQMFIKTYAVEDGDITEINNSPIYTYHTTYPYNLNSIPENLLFNTTNFNGGAVDGCKLDASTNLYTCLAKREINITGNINVSAPYKVEFVASEKIKVNPNSNVYGNQNVLLKMGSPMQTTPMPPATQTTVTNFCNGLGSRPYLADQSSSGKTGNLSDEDDSKVTPLESEYNFDLEVYPNPTRAQNQLVNVRYTTSADAATAVFITDLYGRIVVDVQPKKQVKMGVYTLPVDIGTLTPGVYFCTIIAENQRKTKKVVVME